MSMTSVMCRRIKLCSTGRRTNANSGRISLHYQWMINDAGFTIAGGIYEFHFHTEELSRSTKWLAINQCQGLSVIKKGIGKLNPSLIRWPHILYNWHLNRLGNVTRSPSWKTRYFQQHWFADQNMLDVDVCRWDNTEFKQHLKYSMLMWRWYYCNCTEKYRHWNKR